jgi:hypothetical protein
MLRQPAVQVSIWGWNRLGAVLKCQFNNCNLLRQLLDDRRIFRCSQLIDEPGQLDP